MPSGHVPGGHCCFCRVPGPSTLQISPPHCLEQSDHAASLRKTFGMAAASSPCVSRDIQDRAFRFAVRICAQQTDNDFRLIVRRTLLRQLVEAATSVGANLEEATAAQTKADFVAKIAIARKECRETQYWLRLAEESRVCGSSPWRELGQEAEAIGKIVSAISRSARRSNSRGD